MKNRLRKELEAMKNLQTGDSFTAEHVHTLVDGILEGGGEFKYVNYDSTNFPYPQTIGNTADSIVGLGNADESMIDTIFLMPNKGTDSTATMMIVVDEKEPSTNPKTYQYVYVGNINNLPSDVLTEGSIVNDLTTGGTDKPLSAEQGRALNSHVNYTTCGSNTGDQVKLISDEGFELSTHLRLLVKMNNTNTHVTPKFNINSTGEKDVWYNGSVASDINTWAAGEVLDVYYDGTKYIANTHGGAKFSTGEKVGDVGIDDKPAAGSDNLVKSGGVQNELALGAVYDVSAHNGGAVFESLSALLSNANLNTLIPTAVRKGGMSIKFIQGSVPNSDNKYVQYRLLTQNFSIDPSDWQGIAEELYGDKVSKTYNATAGTTLNTTSNPVELNVQSGTDVTVYITATNYNKPLGAFYINVNDNWQSISDRPLVNIKKKYTFQDNVTAFGFLVYDDNISSDMTFNIECYTNIGIKGNVDNHTIEIVEIGETLPLKADYNEESVNLFNPEDDAIMDRHYINADGKISENNYYIISAPFEVKPGESVVSNKLGLGTTGALFLSKTGETVGYFTNQNSPCILTNNSSEQILFARFSYSKDQTGIMVNRGTSSLSYQPYIPLNRVIREDTIVQDLGSNTDKVISQAKMTEVIGSNFGGNAVKSREFPTTAGTNLNTTSYPTLFNAKKGDMLYIRLIGEGSNINAKADAFYYRSNGNWVNGNLNLEQGYIYAYIMPVNADAFGILSLGESHSTGHLQFSVWTEVSVPTNVEYLKVKNWTLRKVVRQWMNGDKCPIGFIGDSTTDGTGTTDWTVQNSHPRQDARNWLEDHPEFMPDATTEEREMAAQNQGKGRGTVDYICEKAYPYILERLIQAELGNNNARIYNIGYYGMDLSSFKRPAEFFSDVYSDCKMAGIMLGINDRGSVNNYGAFYNRVLQLLEQYVFTLNDVGVVPFMVTNQYVTQSGNNPNTGGGVPDIMYNDDVQTITNRAKVEVAKKYGLEVIDMNGFGRLLFMCSNYAYSNLTEDLHFKDLGHKLEAGFLFSQLIPWVNKTGDAAKIYIGFGGAYNKSDFNVGKFETDTNDRFKREINYERSESTDICIFDSYVFNDSVNGAYTVKYLTPVASGYIVIDGDTSNPITINSTEMVLDPWDIGLHHVQVYTGNNAAVAFKGFLLEQQS